MSDQVFVLEVEKYYFKEFQNNQVILVRDFKKAHIFDFGGLKHTEDVKWDREILKRLEEMFPEAELRSYHDLRSRSKRLPLNSELIKSKREMEKSESFPLDQFLMLEKSKNLSESERWDDEAVHYYNSLESPLKKIDEKEQKQKINSNSNHRIYLLLIASSIFLALNFFLSNCWTASLGLVSLLIILFITVDFVIGYGISDLFGMRDFRKPKLTDTDKIFELLKKHGFTGSAMTSRYLFNRDSNFTLEIISRLKIFRLNSLLEADRQNKSDLINGEIVMPAVQDLLIEVRAAYQKHLNELAMIKMMDEQRLQQLIEIEKFAYERRLFKQEINDEKE